MKMVKLKVSLYREVCHMIIFEFSVNTFFSKTSVFCAEALSHA